MGKKEEKSLSPEELVKQQAAQKQKQLKRIAGKMVDPITGVTGRQLKAGYWWISHKLLLRKLLFSLVLLLAVLLVGYSIYGWSSYYSYGYWKEKNMVAEMIEQPVPFSAYHKKNAPQPVQDDGLKVFDSGTKSGWKDLIVPIANPNEKWVAHIDYHFEDGEQTTEPLTDMLLPLQESVIGVLGYAPSTTVKSPQFVMDDVSWERIDPHVVEDVQEFISSRLDFAIENIEIKGPGEIEDVKTHVISFDLTNNTLQSYWEVPLFVELYRNDRLVGVEQVTVSSLELQQTQHVDLRSFSNERRITDIRVTPKLNIFDESVYKALGDELGAVQDR